MTPITLIDRITITIISLCVLALLFAVWLSRESQVSERRVSRHLSLKGLYDFSGKKDQKSHECYLLHYSSVGCHFCSQEEPAWTRLKQEAIVSKCAVEALAPHSSQLSLEEGANSVVFVPVIFAKNFSSTAVPTTVLTDSNDRVLFVKVGAIESKDEAELIAKMKRAN